MKNALVRVLCVVASTTPALLSAQPVPKPSAEEARRVMDYYYQGQGQGPLLVDFRACLKVDTEPSSKTKGSCIEQVKGPVKRNSQVYAWAVWLLPEGEADEDVFIQFVHDGTVRSTQDMKLAGVFRTRTWRSSTLGKSGKWELKAVRKGTELGKVELTVE
jgi:hypothetical protein